MPDVWIPPQMQRRTGAPDRVQVDGATVRQVINNLERLHPGIKDLLYDAELDDITPGLAVIVDGDVSQLGLMERVSVDSEMHFLPAIGGGADADPTPAVAGDDSAADGETAPRTLADLLEGYIGVIDSSEFGPEGRKMPVDTGNQFAPAIGGGADVAPAPDAAGDDPAADGKAAPRTLADLLEGYIGVIHSSELGPRGGSLSVNTGKQFAEDLWEEYQRDQEKARQRYAKECAQQQQAEQ